jgi:hypothetical protein
MMINRTLRRGRAAAPIDPDRLRDEIEMLERRLRELGPDGDCGYENAMIRFYERELGRRRSQLSGGATCC